MLEHRIVKQFMCGYSPNVSLLYEHPSVVNALGQPQFEHLCLQPSLQEVFNFEPQNVIQFHARLVQHSYTYQSPEKSVTLEQTSRVFLIQR